MMGIAWSRQSIDSAMVKAPLAQQSVEERLIFRRGHKVAIVPLRVSCAISK